MDKQWIIGLVMMIATFVACVFLHELGHFIVLKIVYPAPTDAYIVLCEMGAATYVPVILNESQRFWTKVGGGLFLYPTLISIVKNPKLWNMEYITVCFGFLFYTLSEVIFL